MEADAPYEARLVLIERLEHPSFAVGGQLALLLEHADVSTEVITGQCEALGQRGVDALNFQYLTFDAMQQGVLTLDDDR